MNKLNKIVKSIKHLQQGLPADWNNIEGNFDWYMKANYPDDNNIGYRALFSLTEEQQQKVFEALRNIKKGDDTI